MTEVNVQPHEAPLEGDMSRGVAMASSLAAIPQVDQDKRYSLGIGTGFFNGESSVAVGVSVRLTTNGVFKGGIAFSSSDSAPTGNAGVAFSW
jgi:autotransporter adhesin